MFRSGTGTKKITRVTMMQLILRELSELKQKIADIEKENELLKFKGNDLPRPQR